MKQLFTLFLIGLLFNLSLSAQETAATLRGTVTDAKGNAFDGVSVLLRMDATGFKTSTLSNNKGIFIIPNLKPGGPYEIIFSYVGYQSQKVDDIFLTLGNNPDISIVFREESRLIEEVVVNATRRTNGGFVVNKTQINNLPNLGRSLSDITRATPQSNNNSFAGSNFRYNNLSIDGASNNDAIGFSNSFGGVSGGGQSGAAGAGTRTNPYSVETIQEVQVQIAPFDVKLGNFTGGSVNAITKSGTNNFQGAVYGFMRNRDLMGKSVNGLKTKMDKTFHEYQYGVTFGGPIVKDKAFYFVNVEQTRRNEPSSYKVGDPGAAITLSEAQSITAKLQNLGYDPGSYLGAYRIFTNSDKVFARFDMQLKKGNSLMIRAIYTHGWGNNLERSSTNFQFGSTDFTQHTKNLNLVTELKTKISNQLTNQFNINFIQVHEYRNFPGQLAPFIDIDNGRIWLGTWREASIYKMKQKTVEITDNLTYIKGVHKFTFGTHNELYDLTYGFINSWNGRWEYSRGVNSFINNNPTRVRGAYSRDITKLANSREEIYNNPPNPFMVGLLSFYAQDELSISNRFKLTPGLRVDYSFVGNQPGIDSNLNGTQRNTNTNNPTYSNTPFNELKNNYLGKASLSPRLGFYADLKGNGKWVVRGGTGIFLGRLPFAWLGYGYTLNGNIYGNIDWNNIASGVNVPIAINTYGLKDTITKYGGASKSSTREIDIVDNNFKLPRVWRTNIAFDVKFGKGYKFTFDALYTKTLYDIKFQQINLFDSVQYFNSGGPVLSPIYVARASGTNGKYNANYSNIYFMSNTNEGYRYNLTWQLGKSSNKIRLGANKSLNLNWNIAYTIGKSKDISNGIRNSWESNYSVNPAISPNDPQLGYSNFDLRNRFVATIASNWHWNSQQTTSLAFFFAAQSGNPYTLIYQSAPGAGGSNASLPYIPKNQSDIRLVDYSLNGQVYTAAQQWNDLNNFINNDHYLMTRKGQYAERNGLRTPGLRQLDMKLMHEFKLSRIKNKHTLQISLDVFNVLNLLNNVWGHVSFVTNVNQYTVNFLKYVNYNVDAGGNPVAVGTPGSTTGKNVGTPSSGYIPTFNFIKPSGIDNQYYTLDPINSRWQGQFGIKYQF